MKILEFFQGPDNRLSSWRLIGILFGVLTAVCVWKAVVFLIAANNPEHLLRVIDSAEFFTASCLAGGLSQHFLAKKSNDNPQTTGSN